MNTKCLIKMFVATLIATSSVQAADTIMPPQKTNSRVTPIIAARNFSWTGLYFGGQIGNFSSKDSLNYSEDATAGKWGWVDKDLLPKPSGFVLGLYGGSNVELGKNFVIGVDTDMIWSGKARKKDTKTDDGEEIANDNDLNSINAVFKEADIPIKKPGAGDETIPNIGDIVVSSVTLKEKWAGAARVRLGFASDHVMPYISGGIAYAQLQYIMSLLAKSQEDQFVFASGDVLNEAKTMIGYTIGGGLDFAVTNHLIFRTEYRYSDFGKKKFGEDKLEIHHKTNNFRVGLAYKF
ncbi:outer membrane protein [Bartonella acomydis]|uniref:Porin family protein n=1 Tax=Bartonella acomydis TaxID=686234 RepID=A0ABP9MFB1_9HYPH